MARAEKMRDGTGSGFFVTPDGYFVTNHHVVRGADAVEVKIADKTYSARVVKLDPQNDIAVLKVEGTFSCLALGADLETRPGDDVFTIGFPMTDVMGEAPKTTLGTVSAVSGIGDDPRMFQISAQIQSGNSGGPLMLKTTGSVIGVTSSSLSTAKLLEQGRLLPQNVNYAVKASYIRPLLAAIPGLSEKLPTIHIAERTFREVQKQAEKSVGLVTVYKEKMSEVSFQAALAVFKKEIVAAVSAIPEAEAAGQAGDIAREIQIIRSISSRLHKVSTEGLPLDLKDFCAEFCSVYGKFAGVFADWPSNNQEIERYIKSKYAEDTKFLDRLMEKGAAVMRDMEPCKEKLTKLRKKYDLDSP